MVGIEKVWIERGGGKDDGGRLGLKGAGGNYGGR